MTTDKHKDMRDNSNFYAMVFYAAISLLAISIAALIVSP